MSEKLTKRLSVVVKHISNEEIEHHVNVLGVKKQRKPRSSCGIAEEFFNDIPTIKKKNADAKDPETKTVKSVYKPKEKDVLEEIASLTPSTLVENNSQYGGADIFSFKTPKRSKQMSKVAAESTRKINRNKKPNSKENSDPKVPSLEENTKKLSEKKSNDEEIESKIPTVNKNRTATGSKTPGKKKDGSKATEKVSKKYLVQELQAQQHEDSNSSDASESEDEEDKVDEDEPVTSSQSTKRINLPSETELYFEAHKAGRRLGATTSDRTLARLKASHVGQEQMQTILEDIDKNKIAQAKKAKGQGQSDTIKIEIARQRLLTSHRTYFPVWMFYICNGYNILMYGLGSKRALVHEFCEKMLSKYDKIVINGYFPSLIMKSILSSICEVTDDINVAHSNQQQAQVDAICKKYSDDENDKHIFIIIHNIDGATLRNQNVQNVLSQLAGCPKIHFVATIDHINASLIWDQSKLSHFKWLWFDITTFEPYKDETSFEDSLLLLTSGTGIGGSLALSGLVHVARSLTPNARGIFKLLAEFQIEESKTNSVNYIGLSFSDLYQMCREKFLVNSELTLRTQLTEFLDHKLVQIKKGIDGGEYLSIPLDNATLQEYLDQNQ